MARRPHNRSGRKRPLSFRDFRRLSPAENIEAGSSPKARRYVPKWIKRATKRTATISARQYETLRTNKRYHIATPELATEARKRGALSYSSAVQRESVAKAANTREEKRYHAELTNKVGHHIDINNPNRRRHGSQARITTASVDRYLDNRRKKLAGEYIPDGEYQEMMDQARAVKDARLDLLRASPTTIGIKGVA
jgi:hypothetical protein